MARLADQLSKEVFALFESDWRPDYGGILSAPQGASAGKHFLGREATVLCAQLAEAAELVKFFQWWFAADVHQAYLGCACRIIQHNGGEVLSCQGERVLASFEGQDSAATAVHAALQINYAARRIIMPAILASHPRTLYHLRHACGIAQGIVLGCRGWMDGGVQTHWLGLPVSQATGLCLLREGEYACYLTDSVHEALTGSFLSATGQVLSQEQYWKEQGIGVYCWQGEEMP